jgi:hypothetical protein
MGGPAVARGEPAAAAGTVRRYIDHLQHGDLHEVARHLAPGYRCTASFGEFDRGGWLRTLKTIHDHFAAVRLHLIEVITSHDRVVTRWTLFGRSECGSEIDVHGISIDRVAGERILESQIVADLLPALERLGAVRSIEPL